MARPPLRIVIVGATSAIASACARLWILAGCRELILLGRDPVKLEREAADLRVRGPQARITTRVVNFLDPLAIQAAVKEIADTDAIDLALVAHGSLPDQKTGEQDLAANHEALLVNGISPVLFAEALVGVMVKAGRGSVGLIGSVAGDRGRKSNYIYGSAKGLMDRYAQGLQHRLAGTQVRVTLIKPGPTDTPMTATMKQQGVKLASVEGVAKSIVAALERGSPVVYAPAKWLLIMLVIKHLPRAVFNRMNI